MAGEDLELAWEAACAEYSRTVFFRGAGTDAARTAWRFADDALDRLVEERAKQDAEKEPVSAT